MHRLGGYGILPYPRSHQTIFPQNPTQPNHLCASVRICGRLFSARSFCVFCEIRGRTLRSHQTIFPQNSRNTQKRLAEKKNLCASVKSVGEYPPLEASVNSVKSVGGYSPPEASVYSVKSVGGLAQANLEWVLWKEFGGQRGYGRDAIPTYENSHRLHGYAQIRRVWHPAIPTQPPNYLPTEFTEHTETSGGEEKSVYICEIRGRISSARSFCVFCEFRGRLFSARSFCKFCAIRGRISSARNFCEFCEFRGRFLSEAMLVQRRPLHPLKIAMLQQQGCHATTTRLPRYNNKIATLRQQGCHATAKYRETDVR